MEYLYYQQRTLLKMTKEDSESKKNYSNIKPIQIDPLGEKLLDVGMAGGAARLKQIKLEDKRLKKIEDKKLKQSEYQMRLRKYKEGYGGGKYPDPRKKFKIGMKKNKDGKLFPIYKKVEK